MGAPSNEVLAQEATEDLQAKAAGRHQFMSHPASSEAAEAEFEAGQALALKGAQLPAGATESAYEGFDAGTNVATHTYDRKTKTFTSKEEVAEQQLQSGAISPSDVRSQASNPAQKIITGSNPDRGPLPQDIGKIDKTSNADPNLTKPVLAMSPEEKEATAGAVPNAGEKVGAHAEPGTEGFKHYVRPMDSGHHAIAAQHGTGAINAATMDPGHGMTHRQPPEDEEGHHRTPGSAIPVTGADKMDANHGKPTEPRFASYLGTQQVIATAHGDPHTATGQRMRPQDGDPVDSTPGSDRAKQLEDAANNKPHQFSPTGEQKADDYHH